MVCLVAKRHSSIAEDFPGQPLHPYAGKYGGFWLVASFPQGHYFSTSRRDNAPGTAFLNDGTSTERSPLMPAYRPWQFAKRQYSYRQASTCPFKAPGTTSVHSHVSHGRVLMDWSLYAHGLVFICPLIHDSHQVKWSIPSNWWNECSIYQPQCR